MHRLRHKFHKTAAEYALIEEGDRILIAVSGGKDSLALLELIKQKEVQIMQERNFGEILIQKYSEGGAE